MSTVGSSIKRIEGAQKVTGQARYVAEHASDLYPDLRHAVVVPATVAADRIRAIDTAAARTAEQAQAAAGLIAVDYETAPALTTWPLLTGEAQPERLPPPLAKRADVIRGNVDAALAQAAATIATTADTPGHSPSAMELAATVAAPDGQGGLVVHDSTQWVLGCRNMLSRQLGLPLERIRVVAPFVGGGFGAKCFTWPHTVLAAVAALAIGLPVRLVLSRAQMHRATGGRPAAHQRITLGADGEGRLTAIRQHATSQTSVGDTFVRAVGEVSEVLYACPNLETRNTVLRTHTATPTNMRAPGESYGSFALETAMDMLAERTGTDPVELRLRNVPGTHPEDGTPFSTNALRACLTEGAAAFGWAGRPPPRTLRDGREWVG